MASSQKFIARNRAPRVQIEYDVELYGAEKKIQLPFVMGVMSDLAGKSEVAQPSIADRKFLEIDVDNFDSRMKSMMPRAAFTVPNTLTGEGNMAVDITFESMDDFSPAAIAAKVEPLKKLLDARTQLSNLMTYMDGKSGAESLIENVLNDRALLQALVSGTAEDMGQSEALSSLRETAEIARIQEVETAGKEAAATVAALAALRANQPEAEEVPDASHAALEALRASGPSPDLPDDSTNSTLDALRAKAPVHVSDSPNPEEEVLAALRASVPADEPAEDNSAALNALRNAAPVADEPVEDNSAALNALRNATPVADEPAEDNSAALNALRNAAPVADEPAEDNSAVFEAVRASGPMGHALGPEQEEDPLAALLADAAPTAEEDDPLAALGSLLESPETNSENDPLADLLADAEPTVDDIENGVAQAGIGSLLAGQEEDALAALLADVEPESKGREGADTTEAALLTDLDDIDDLLATPVGRDFEGADPEGAPATGQEHIDPLDARLASLGPEPARPEPDAPATTDTTEDFSDPSEIPLAEVPSPEVAEGPDLDDLEGLLPVSYLGITPEIEGTQAPEQDLLDTLLAADDPQPDPLDDLVDLETLLGEMSGADAPEPAPPAVGLDVPPPTSPAPEPDPLDALLAEAEEVGAAPTPEHEAALQSVEKAEHQRDQEPDQAEAVDDVTKDILADLDALMAETEALEQTLATATAEPEDAMSVLDDLIGGAPAAPLTTGGGRDRRFGTLTARQPSIEALDRPQFRMAIFGDFSGRAARGAMEVGAALASRRAIALDVDTVEDVIEGFATTLVLPIGPDGKGISVKLGGLDDLHPDELVDNLELFDALKGLRARLSNASTAASAVREMQGWGDSFTQPAAPTQGRSSASGIPANKKLSDFQKLIGDTTGRLTQASPIDDLIGQIVGPHIVPGPNPEAEALKASVDEAMSSAMRLVLHHPEFQAIEAQWRMLDLLARRVETDVKLTITLFDVSAEEIAADLASVEDLAQSGLFQLLNAPLQEDGGIGFSAMFGMYAFEETPPHAELLARIGKIASHMEAPFVASMTPGFMDVPMIERHPLTAAAWDKLREMPEAHYLGLAAPRFLLRRPYGKKTESIDAFGFEEFTQSEGLKGMLWANPAVLVAILMAQEWQDGGRKMTLGNVMSLDDIPFHFVQDRHGDQVALPCTERNLTESRSQLVLGRGYMPVVSLRGRDVVRLASFNALGGGALTGPWSGPLKPRVAPTGSPLDVEMTAKLAPDAAKPVAQTHDAVAPDAGEDDLDALLAGFGDISAPTDPDAIDADLAALLEGL